MSDAVNSLGAPQLAQTLRRGLSILRVLTRIGPSGLRMTEICQRLALNKATVIRLTQTLVDEGFVLHDSQSKRYRLGPEAFAVGLAAEPSFRLQRAAAPVLKKLAMETGDTVFFSVLHGYESICLSRDEGDFPIRNQLIKAGDRWPLGVGAGSCAMLAAQTDLEISNVLKFNFEYRRQNFPLCTDKRISTLVQQTRELGYCVQPGLVIADSWAVGAAIYDQNDRPVAAVSIAAIKSRLGIARSSMIGNRLIAECEKLRHAMNQS
jgi:DNA-binding IclR family transcriptional regulator